MADESLQKTEETKETTTGQTAAASTEEQPNIFVIMNEAFSDLRVYGDFETSEDFMPFIDSMKENTVKGNLYVSVKKIGIL